MAKKAKAIVRTVAEMKEFKNYMGQPTKYDPKYCDEIINYFDVKLYEEKNGREVASDIPTLAGFAAKLKVHRDTLHTWTKIYPQFADALRIAKEMQENWIAVNGNKGLINPAFAIFTAKNVLNWRDKKDVEITGNVTNMTDEELERKLQEKLGQK